MHDNHEQVEKDIAEVREVNRKLQAQNDAQRIFDLAQRIRSGISAFQQSEHQASLNGTRYEVQLKGVTESPERKRYPFDFVTSDEEQASITVRDARTKEKLHEVTLSRPRGERGVWGATEYLQVQNGASEPVDFPEVKEVPYTPDELHTIGSRLSTIREVLESIPTQRKG